MDSNLELALVEQLLRDGKVSFDRDAFLQAHPPKKQDDGEDEEAHLYRRNRDIEDALCALLQPAHLPSIDGVVWEGGMTTQHLVWNYWDGEDDAFDIESLAGIEACTSLVSLSIYNTNAIRDLSPVAGLAGLELLRIGGGGHPALIEDVSPLAGLTRLRTLDLSNNRTLKDVATLAAIAALEVVNLTGCAVQDVSFAVALPRLRTLAVGPHASAASATTLAALRARGVSVRDR